MANNLIEKSGSWYSFQGERIGQGRENAKQFLKENGDIAAKIDTGLRTKLGLPIVEEPGQDKPAAKGKGGAA